MNQEALKKQIAQSQPNSWPPMQSGNSLNIGSASPPTSEVTNVRNYLCYLEEEVELLRAVVESVNNRLGTVLVPLAAPSAPSAPTPTPITSDLALRIASDVERIRQTRAWLAAIRDAVDI